MASFDCDDKDTERALCALHDLIVNNGGFVHPDLRFVSRKGVVTVFSPYQEQSNNPSEVIRVGQECLVPRTMVKLGLSGNEIEIRSLGSGLTPVHRSVIETYIELFNVTHKIETYREVNAWIYSLTDPEFFGHLYGARELPGKRHPYANTVDSERLILDSFMNTRTLGFRFQENAKDTVPIYIPILDLVNNHPQAPGFVASSGEDGPAGVSIVRNNPQTDSDECAVSYGPYDTYDLFLNYNYVDTNPSFVRSVPVEIELTDAGRLIVHAYEHNQSRHEKLPKELEDLRFYLPAFHLDLTANLVEAGYILIPQKMAPFAMRRVLTEMIRRLRPGLDQNILMAHVEYAEQKILEENVRHYRELLAYLDDRTPRPGQETLTSMAKEAARAQLEQIARYPFLSASLRAETLISHSGRGGVRPC